MDIAVASRRERGVGCSGSVGVSTEAAAAEPAEGDLRAEGRDGGAAGGVREAHGEGAAGEGD